MAMANTQGFAAPNRLIIFPLHQAARCTVVTRVPSTTSKVCLLYVRNASIIPAHYQNQNQQQPGDVWCAPRASKNVQTALDSRLPVPQPQKLRPFSARNLLQSDSLRP
jgi:hypothetical protein